MYLNEMSREVAQRTGMTIKDTSAVITELQRLMKEKILFGEDVRIHRIGKLQHKVFKEKKMYSEFKKDSYTLKKRYLLKFTMDKSLRDALRLKTVY